MPASGTVRLALLSALVSGDPEIHHRSAGELKTGVQRQTLKAKS
jgi:hypothetical protein